MSTLQELIRYCSEDHHLGVLLLTGEWGCGKTYLIDEDLSEALSETHFIVRVSLLGLDSISELNNAVRKQWLQTCTPFLGKLKQERERLKSRSSLLSAIANVLSAINPVKSSIASAIVSVDPLEYLPLEPLVEDLHDGAAKKRVILVFDDLNRSKMDLNSLVGTITEYCENKGFATIVIAEDEFLGSAMEADPAVYKMLKDKTIARVVRYVPDFQGIIRRIITQNVWQSREYAEYLAEKEQLICDVFVSDPLDREDGIGKYHNFRSLTCALQDYYRLFTALSERGARDTDRFLYSYITYILVSRNGISKDGQPCFDVSEEEIRQLYPGYAPETLPESIREWIEYGIWDEDAVSEFVSGLPGEEDQEKTQTAPADEPIPVP